MKKSSEELYKVELERQKEWFDGIEKDLLLNEATKVLTDMVGM